MKRILAIAHIAIRNAIRSRMVASLLAILLVAMVVIPLTVQGDGTLEGHVRIVIGYTMGFATALLGLAALWAGALSVAQEIAERQVHLLAVKPVRRGEIWLGKWLGLMAVNLALLAACGATTYGLLRWTTRPAQMQAASRDRLWTDVLAAHRPVRPVLPDVEADAVRVLDERRARGDVSPDAPAAVLLPSIRQELLLGAGTVPPGERRTWMFRLPAATDPTQRATLRYRFSSSRYDLEPVRCLWLAGTPAQPTRWQEDASAPPTVPQVLQLPPGLTDASGQLLLSCVNNNPDPVTVVFDLRDGLTLMVPAGDFESNFARALLVALGRLAFLTALGITLGSLFSIPVAVFMAMALMLILQLSGYVESLSAQEIIVPWHQAGAAGPAWADVALRQFFRLLHALLAPLGGPPVLDAVATGLVVDTATVLRAWLVEVVLYGGVLGLLGTGVLNRRELALPTT